MLSRRGSSLVVEPDMVEPRVAGVHRGVVVANLVLAKVEHVPVCLDAAGATVAVAEVGPETVPPRRSRGGSSARRGVPTGEHDLGEVAGGPYLAGKRR